MKVINNEQGTYKRTFVNSYEDMEVTNDIIEFVCGDMKSFSRDNRVITSMTVTVNYCNTDVTTIPAYDDIHDEMIDYENLSAKGIISWDESKMRIQSEDGVRVMRYKEQTWSMRHRLIYYLNATCSRGMLDVYAFNRFAETIIAIFEVLTRVEKDTNDVNHILQLMELPYEVKEYPPTVACPEHFFKLIRINEFPSAVTDDESNDDHEAIAKKIDEFMQQWFNNGNGKVYDKDRNEFYMEFMTMYEAAKEQDDKGMIPVTRRKQKQRTSKNIMAMKELINYSGINDILKQYGLNYHITYQQEVNTTGEGPKRRNSLSLKDHQ